MSDTVINTLLGSFTTIVLGVLAFMQAKNNSRVKKIKYQVENNHVDENGNPINLREEADERHEQNTHTLHTIATKVDKMNDKVDHVNKKVDRLFGIVADNDNRIDDLEDTLDMRKGKNNEHR